MIFANLTVCALCGKKTQPGSLFESYRVICFQCGRELFNLNLANREQKLADLRDRAMEAWLKEDKTQSALFLYQLSFYRDGRGGFRTFGSGPEEPREPLVQEFEGPIFGDSLSYLIMVPNLPTSLINFGPPKDFDSNRKLESLYGRPWRMFDEKFTNTYESELLLSEIFVKTLSNPEVLLRFAVKDPWLLLEASNYLMAIDWAFFFDLSDWVKARFKSLEAVLLSDSLDCRLGAGLALFQMVEQRPIVEWAQLGDFELVIEGGSSFESRLRYFDNVVEDAELFADKVIEDTEFVSDWFTFESEEDLSLDDDMFEAVLNDLERDYFLMTDEKKFLEAFEVHLKILMTLKEAPASEFPSVQRFRDYFATP